eukprot:TRINITY_DN20939_c0_g1_i1.p1 TRINITY_DN20939_c0_g1~~TRINITY_DN20939_c0_g1_i1.p1  ORF type:complete len:272 (+),score=29.39 TRINITY_DN20939_c0_g1_i1:239-1054(+)
MASHVDPFPRLKDTVRLHLEGYCQRFGGSVLLAAVVGSRMKGLGSTKSDYDIRVVWKPPIQKYLTIDANSCLENDGTFRHQVDSVEFEYLVWDLRRFLYLLKSSNADCVDALVSPLCVLADEAFLQRARELCLGRIDRRRYGYCLHANASANLARFCVGKESVSPSDYLYVVHPALGLQFLHSHDSGLPPGSYNERVVATVTDHTLFETLMSLAYRKRSGERGNRDKLHRIEDLVINILAKDPKNLPSTDFDEGDLNLFFSETMMGVSDLK